VGPTREDACTHKGVDCRDPKGGLAIHGISHRLGKHVRSDFPLMCKGLVDNMYTIGAGLLQYDMHVFRQWAMLFYCYNMKD